MSGRQHGYAYDSIGNRQWGDRTPASRLKEVHTRTHPARFALDPELAAELADEEAHDELANKAD